MDTSTQTSTQTGAATTLKALRHGCCPVEATLDVIGGRWKGVIVYHLMDGPKRFGELCRRLPAITQRMLTLQLRELEADGIVHREIFRQIPPKVEYSLTELGRSLEPTLLLLCNWGKYYMELASQQPSPEASSEMSLNTR